MRTRSRTLIYDTGNAWPRGFDSGRHVLLPHLRAHGVTVLDKIVLSHKHQDHVGGYDALSDVFQPGALLSNVQRFSPQEPCLAGTTWNWDQVVFELLWPATTNDIGNNGSCVIRIEGHGGSVLLTGDIEAEAELALLRRSLQNADATGQARLATDVLLVAHQGSKTSTGGAFLRAVRPSIAIISAGRHNRFGHPAAEVVERLAASGVRIWSTANHGAIAVRIERRGKVSVQSFKTESSRFWHSW